MPVSMIPTFTPVPVRPRSCQALGAPMYGIETVLSIVYVETPWTPTTPGSLARAAMRFARTWTLMPL